MNREQLLRVGGVLTSLGVMSVFIMWYKKKTHERLQVFNKWLDEQSNQRNEHIEMIVAFGMMQKFCKEFEKSFTNISFQHHPSSLK